MLRLSILRWLFLTLMMAVGCQASNGRYPVSGDVSLDGEAVDQGAIVFMPTEGETIKSGGRITDGRYTIVSEKGPALGKHRVLLYWEKKTGKTYVDRDSGDVYDRREEGLPKIYQSENSPLLVEITSGTNIHDFKLSSASE
jgi:hypothetical protein